MILENLYCIFEEEKHFVKDALSLPCCESLICKECIQRCKVCSVCNNPIEPEKLRVTSLMDEALDEFKKELFALIKDEIELSLNNLQDTVNELDRRIDLKFEFVREEIEIRIESIKIELDALNEKLQNQLNEAQAKINELRKVEFNTNFFYDKLSELKTKIEENNLAQDIFYEFEKDLLNIKSLLKHSNEFNYQINFLASDEKLNNDIIGEVKVNRFVPWKKSEVTTIVKIDKIPINLSVNEYNELIVSTRDHLLQVYDEQFHNMLTIERINNQKFYPYGVAINSKNNYFICDARNNRILQTDHNLSYMNEFGGKNKLNSPYDACLYLNSLLICDQFRIQKVSTTNLTHEATFVLDKIDYPLEIKCSNNVVCVRKYSGMISFYELPSFQLKTNYENYAFSCICVYNTHFYAYSYLKQKVYCFDFNGVLVQEENLNLSNLIPSQDINSMIFYNKRLVIAVGRCLAIN